MPLIIEVLFLIFGLWALFTGRLPAFLFGGGKYRIEGPLVRGLGVLMLMPLPIAVVLGVVTMMAFGPDALSYATLLEVGMLVLVMVAGLIVVYRVRQPITPEASDALDASDAPAAPASPVEDDIQQKATSALIMSLLCFTGIGAFVFGPWAVIRGRRAEALIKQHEVGKEYLVRAQIGVVIGVLMTLAVVICAINFAVFLIRGG
jgi:hypothetical protein